MVTETIIQLNGFWYKVSYLRCQIRKNGRWQTIRRTPGRRALMQNLQAARKPPRRSIEKNPQTGKWEMVML